MILRGVKTKLIKFLKSRTWRKSGCRMWQPGPLDPRLVKLVKRHFNFLLEKGFAITGGGRSVISPLAWEVYLTSATFDVRIVNSNKDEISVSLGNPGSASLAIKRLMRWMNTFNYVPYKGAHHLASPVPKTATKTHFFALELLLVYITKDESFYPWNPKWEKLNPALAWRSKLLEQHFEELMKLFANKDYEKKHKELEELGRTLWSKWLEALRNKHR